MSTSSAPAPASAPAVKRKALSFTNLALGAGLTIFEASTLGQPFEVVKTHMAANRGDNMLTAISKTFKRGGILGFYQGLIPWAWIEGSTKGAVLLFTASELEYQVLSKGGSATAAGIIGGMGGGIAQAYTTMGFCTFMKTVEVTRSKDVGVAREIFAREGFAGINKGVNAVALRQCTNWGSRFGISRIVEDVFMRARDDRSKPLSSAEKVLASAVGGALSCWNQPLEVIRVEMQSQIKTEGRPEKLTIATAAKWIYKNNGLKGFYRGVTPRVGLGIWQTVCIVFGGDQLKAYVASYQKQKKAAQ
ncbi:mitochondrial carrier domain-containing protein [Polychytrium aggregatum]|uniref:mitochondrial carrier domain-containing protein n=1 Tax=Polychytrium aggregatum TaxID=110093 RepID=UPI0022FDB9EF|nr:mitochondrial carrier domain-containing protein [Polychytrium aggregatum]KAI9202475.1 mitochondrial carrier domain-containing protein [Polychytrium aggregatum]